MSAIIQQIENEQLKSDSPSFSSGDTLIVWVKVKEGSRERLQAFEGVVIAIKNRGVHSSFTVRKISHGEGVERVFQTHSPLISSIEVKRHGKVRQSRLYYLRELTGRKARIKEDLSRRNANKNKATKEAKKETKETKETKEAKEAPDASDAAQD